MICPKCKAEGEKSRVYSMGSSRTLMGGSETFWDEDGQPHRHDPNITTTDYNCSRGHRWSEREQSPCPTCGKGNW